jgi:hypothetical protein
VSHGMSQGVSRNVTEGQSVNESRSKECQGGSLTRRVKEGQRFQEVSESQGMSKKIMSKSKGTNCVKQCQGVSVKGC